MTRDHFAVLSFVLTLVLLALNDLWFRSLRRLCPICSRRHAIFPVRGRLNRWVAVCYSCRRARASRGKWSADYSERAPKCAVRIPVEEWRDGAWRPASNEPVKFGETRHLRWPTLGLEIPAAMILPLEQTASYPPRTFEQEVSSENPVCQVANCWRDAEPGSPFCRYGEHQPFVAP